MDDLVERLSKKQSIDFESRTDTLEEVKERLTEMKYASEMCLSTMAASGAQ